MNEINQGNKSILMPSCDKLIVSSSPHIQTTASVSKIMLKVIIALVPAMAAGIYFSVYRQSKPCCLLQFSVFLQRHYGVSLPVKRSKTPSATAVLL